jgi:hypothetical protein
LDRELPVEPGADADRHRYQRRRTGVMEYTRLGNSGLKVSRIALG